VHTHSFKFVLLGKYGVLRIRVRKLPVRQVLGNYLRNVTRNLLGNKYYSPVSKRIFIYIFTNY